MEKKIGKNMSSGAKKVEALGDDAHQIKPQETPARQTKGVRKTQKRTSQQSAAQQAVQAEQEAADARFEAAKARAAKKEAKKLALAQKKQEKLTQKLEAREKKEEALAASKSERAEKLAQKAARKQMLATESEAERTARRNREKRARLAERRQKAEAREQKLKEKQEARKKAQEKRAAQRRDNKKSGGGKKRAPSIGGWIAAVSVLGAACLALATVVTAGYFRMNDMMMQSANGYRATLYELVSVSEDMDDNFAKLRISSGTGEQRTLLTEILVDSAILESALEKMPVDAATGTDMSSFINRTNATARAMLQKLSSGGTLSQEDRERLAALYETNATLCAELNDLALHTPADQLQAFFDGAQGDVTNRLSELGQGMRAERKEISDVPFAGEGNVEDNQLAGVVEITASDAEQKVRQYFEGYHIADVRLTGETLARDVRAYNFVLTDENGTEFFAQVTKNGGQLAFFDSFEACTTKNFDLDSCDTIAQAYLKTLGYEHLTPVWFSDAGMVASITYVAEIEGVRVYPDMIRVRVCEEKGRVVGMDARGYLVNHHGERNTSPALSKAEAQAKLSSDLEVKSAHLALIPVRGREMLTYEFVCMSGEEQFILYLDARTGEEVRIFRVHASAQGSYLS